MRINTFNVLKWKCMGQWDLKMNMWGKIRNIGLCPNCRTTCLVYKKKGKMMIKCKKCPYILISNKVLEGDMYEGKIKDAVNLLFD